MDMQRRRSKEEAKKKRNTHRVGRIGQKPPCYWPVVKHGCISAGENGKTVDSSVVDAVVLSKLGLA